MSSYKYCSGYNCFTWAKHCDTLPENAAFYLFSSNFKFGRNAPRH
jgi:hypothetical protein